MIMLGILPFASDASDATEKKDENLDYGTYYYSDGDRRLDVMEVTLKLSSLPTAKQ